MSDDHDLLGAPRVRRGRPTKAEAEARKLAAEAAAPQVFTDVGNWVETRKPVNLSWLINAFMMDSRTAKARLVNCPVQGTDAKGHNLYAFTEAARYLAKPPPSAIAAFFRGMKVTDLPTFLQDQYWSAQRKRQIYEENAGDLWRTDNVLEVLGEAFGGMKSEIQLWVDNVDRKVALTAEQRLSLTQQVDALQESLYARLVEMPKKKRTYSQVDSGEVVTEKSPQYAEIFEFSDEDLLG